MATFNYVLTISVRFIKSSHFCNLTIRTLLTNIKTNNIYEDQLPWATGAAGGVEDLLGGTNYHDIQTEHYRATRLKQVGVVQ